MYKSVQEEEMQRMQEKLQKGSKFRSFLKFFLHPLHFLLLNIRFLVLKNLELMLFLMLFVFKLNPVLTFCR